MDKFPANKKALMKYLRSCNLGRFSLHESPKGYVLKYKQQPYQTDILQALDCTFEDWREEIELGIQVIELGLAMNTKTTDKEPSIKERLLTTTRTFNGQTYPNNMEGLFLHLTTQCDLGQFKMVMDPEKGTYYVHHAGMKVNTFSAVVQNLSLWEWEFKIEQCISTCEAASKTEDK